MYNVSCKPTCVCCITVHPYMGTNLSVEFVVTTASFAGGPRFKSGLKDWLCDTTTNDRFLRNR
jgi:hypothetical protein